MVFSSLVFLFIFLPIVLLTYFIVPKTVKNFILLIASLFFYAWGEPVYLFLMMFSILLNYLFGLWIQKNKDKATSKKVILTMAIIVNIGLLGYYKYAFFIVGIINGLLHTHIQFEPLPLPLGISFYTFHALSYLIDVYRQKEDAQKNLFNLALYITLFPQLVAGPILRYNTIAEQIKSRTHNLNHFAEGIRILIIGLSKKVLLANPLGEMADTIFSMNPSDMSVTTAWIGITAYTLQIYFDFSGYSDMAIGLGKMFGFDFLPNFNYPYISRNIGEFWRRWHISLSSWFRDYVYIPLGGSRQGAWKTYRNLLIVWTITGFWHGASWTFMAWGFYYGVIICLERLGLNKILAKTWRPIQHAYVLLIVLIGWVFFRADNFTYSFEFITTMFAANGTAAIDHTSLLYLHDKTYLFVLAIIFSTPIYPWVVTKWNTIQHNTKLGRMVAPIHYTVSPFVYMGLLLIVTMFLVNSTYNPFIYFRF